jgi:hypothetical protein
MKTLSPYDTGEMRRVAEPDTAVLHLPPMPPRMAVFLGEGFEPDTNPPHPIPHPRPAGPHPRHDKVMVPLLRPAAPLGEYAEKRSVLYVRPAGAGGPGRHRRPSLLSRLLGGVR